MELRHLRYFVAAGQRVRFVRLDPPVAPIEIGVVTRRGPSSPGVQAFVQALRIAAHVQPSA